MSSKTQSPVAGLEDRESAHSATAAEESSEILVIEDDESMRRLLAEILRAEGYRVAAVPSPVEALDIVENLGEHDSPLYALDLVVADWWMREMTGGDFMEWFRDHDKQTPVVVISAYLTEETAHEALRLDASAVLSKPFGVADFLEVIELEIGA